MKIHLILLAILFTAAQASPQCNADKPKKDKETPPMVVAADTFDKLPDGAKLNDEVREIELDDEGKVISSKVITVEEKLRKFGAGYLDGILVDSKGNQIRFFKPGIRGTSAGPEADKEFYDSERKRLADLKKNFTVIEIYVNPLKIM